MNKTKDAPERLLVRVPEAADALGVSVAMIYEMIGSGAIGTVRVGTRGVRICYADLRAWVEANTSRKNSA